MKNTFITMVWAAAVFSAGTAFPSFLPPDFDFDYRYLRHAPEGLSADWSGEDVYLAWHRVKDKHGDYAHGYRLYRAADRGSVYVQVDTGWDFNIIPSAKYLDRVEAIREAGIITSQIFFYRVTAAVVAFEPYDEDDESEEPAGRLIVYESHFSSPVSIKRTRDFDCFIASAAYGTRMAPGVVVLSSFRDRVLAKSAAGRCLVGIYGKLSPPAAELVSRCSFLRLIVRMHLRPVLPAAAFFVPALTD